MSELNINWNDVAKKEARGLDNADLGEVQGVEQGFIVTGRELIDKHSYFFPKIVVNRFDGETMFLKVTDNVLRKFQKD